MGSSLRRVLVSGRIELDLSESSAAGGREERGRGATGGAAVASSCIQPQLAAN